MGKKLSETIGALIRERRTAKNMTQLELSRELGYESMQFVSLFERGLSKVPHEVIGKLVVILGIPEKQVVKAVIEDFSVELAEKIKEGKKSVVSSRLDK